MRIVLASESEFRRRALDLLGLPYETAPSYIDEKTLRDADPNVLTLKLAEAKANTIAPAFPDSIIVSGDAVVSKNGHILEKPKDLDEATRFLSELGGSRFEFVTALTVLNTRTGRMLSAVESSEISFRVLSSREIERYIQKYDVLRYAGAFESDAVVMFADRITGSYNFVAALPVSRLTVLLREQGIDI